MKLFHFYRTEDQSGVSGTGPVVEGVQFTNGWCALRWLSSKSSICFYQSLEEVKAIHGHGGKTEVVIHDFEPVSRRKSSGSNRRFEILMQIVEEASQVLVLADGSTMDAEAELRACISHLRVLIDTLEVDITAGI